MEQKPPIIVVVGPTASGKTSLSIELTKTFNGEVISADSRQVYRGLDLGSGKVTTAEMAGIPHHLLDVAEPTTVYTASDFIKDGTAALADINQRGRLPIIAGGTFFYIAALLGDSSLPTVAPNPILREQLEQKTTPELIAELTSLDSKRATSIDQGNRRRLIRAIEIATALGSIPDVVTTSPYPSFKIGIAIDQAQLKNNIHQRLLQRLEVGMVAEVEGLLAQGVTHERLEDLGLEYRYLSRYLRGLITYDTLLIEIENKSRQFAKRQLTWLKRDTSIHWYQKTDTLPLEKINQDVQSWLETIHYPEAR